MVTRSVLVGACMAAWLAASPAAQDPVHIQIVTMKIVDGVFMLSGAGGNIGVSVGEDGVLMVDAGAGVAGSISPDTVKKHTYNVYRKLGVQNRVQLSYFVQNRVARRS